MTPSQVGSINFDPSYKDPENPIVQVKYPVNLTAYRCHEDILSQDARSLRQVSIISPSSLSMLFPLVNGEVLYKDNGRIERHHGYHHLHMQLEKLPVPCTLRKCALL